MLVYFVILFCVTSKQHSLFNQSVAYVGHLTNMFWEEILCFGFQNIQCVIKLGLCVYRIIYFVFFYKHAFWFFAFSFSFMCDKFNYVLFFLLYHKLNFLVYLIYSKYLIIIQKAHVYSGNMDCSLLLLDIEVCYSITNPVDSKF